MVDQDTITLLKMDANTWNSWRRNDPGVRIDLRHADLRKADLTGKDLSELDFHGASLSKARLANTDFTAADLSRVNGSRAILRGANLSNAKLSNADLSMADLRKAELYEADLNLADLRGARLGKAQLCAANLIRTNLLGSNLFQANLTGSILSETVLADTLLAGVDGLDQCQHRGPSIIDYRTLERSGTLPLSFLRGCGLPNNLIEYLPSLLNQPIHYYSCFISYSSADQEFAERLYTTLQSNDVRCWYAREDMKIGAKILDTLDEAIRLRDKLLLILSANAIESEWVEDEVTKAFAEERDRKQTVVFPIRIDDAVLDTTKAWAVKLRNNRYIGDFSKWKAHDSFKKSCARLLRDLELNEHTNSD
jgi:hypothetical protein